MIFPIFVRQDVSATAFVNYWAPQYNYKNESLYADNIGKSLTVKRINELFEWKNGFRLSQSKQRSVDNNYISRISELKRVSRSASANTFLSQFDAGGAIWRIFWLHCWNPDRFPIYDQHVHRAMGFIERQVVEEIPISDAKKVESYIERYLPFHKKFRGINSRSVDRALWFFGKSLQSSLVLPIKIGDG